jgi:hypothetical protein
MAHHIFVDNSNIYGGAQRVAGTIEPNVHWLSVRIYYRNLFRLIEEGQDLVTRVLTGSVPPGADPLWQTARDLGYNTDLLRRVEQDDGRLVEQGVDEMLHLKMANAILDHDPPQTLVIASGDGLVSKWETSFPGQAERALKGGWNVQVWSWAVQLTGQYQRLCRDYRPRCIVKVLDPYYRSITFIKGGDYTTNGVTTTVAERIVSPLDIIAPAAPGRAA